MSDEYGKCLTFLWKIKNFNFYSNKSGIYSPVFCAHVLDCTNWKLSLFPNCESSPGNVSCYIRRENDTPGFDSGLIQITYELSFLAGNGSILYSKMFLKKLYNTFNTDWKSELMVNKEEMFVHKKELFMPEDTLTVRCRIWNSQNSISQSENCFAETSIETRCMSFVGTIKKFSGIESGDVYSIAIISTKNNFISFMHLFLSDGDKLFIQMIIGKTVFRPYRYALFIRDFLGNKVKCGQGDCRDPKDFKFPLNLSKENLMENKRYYFPKKVLTIECEIILSTGKTRQNVELEYGFDYEDKGEFISHPIKTNSSSIEYLSESCRTLKDDLNSLFKDGVLCDAQLKTPTETFPVYAAVLSSRSPVFKSLFTKDIKKNKCIGIDDLDADTVRRMLKFMHLDILDELEYESAKSLYYAAVKYNFISLRYRCSSFLKQNVLLKNCCDLLYMADKHKDEDLKNVVKDYIMKNDEVVFLSDEWKNLEQDHPHLTIEVFRAVCMKSRTNKDNA